MALLVCFLLLLNFGISWLNAWSVGRSWNDSKAVGGFSRLVVWSGAVMAACGFTWCYLILLALGANALGKLPDEYAQGAIELGYVVLIIPILGSGITITAHSWLVAIRERRLSSMGIAAWNTYAQIHNTVGAVRGLPKIFDHLGKLLKGGNDSKGKFALLMILLVIAALSAGILTTVMIVSRTAAAYSDKVYDNLERRRDKMAHA